MPCFSLQHPRKFDNATVHSILAWDLRPQTLLTVMYELTATISEQIPVSDAHVESLFIMSKTHPVGVHHTQQLKTFRGDILVDWKPLADFLSIDRGCQRSKLLPRARIL